MTSRLSTHHAREVPRQYVLNGGRRELPGAWQSNERPIIPANVSLTAGTRLGSYEILAPLGAGGMGEVYRARDTKLEREAKTISQLSHPSATLLPHLALSRARESEGMPY